MLETVKIPPELNQATDSLIQNLLASRPILAYHQARAQFDSDAQAKMLLERLSLVQAKLRQKQGQSITQADTDELRNIQERVQANATIMIYVQSQQAAIVFLREINLEISESLGVDFAILSKQCTC